MADNIVKVVGAGLAGVEASLYLANHGVKVKLFDMKPDNFTPAHSNKNFAELVCSNSLKSNDVYGNCAGLLKEELRILGSNVIKVADITKVPAGNALAVNREDFAEILTDMVKRNNNIETVCQNVNTVDFDEFTVIATGPLTSEELSESIKGFVGDGLSFYDASAPIVSKESINMESAFFGDRYDKGDKDHINCPITREEYEEFVSRLISAERVDKHEFEDINVFEGCMPVEIMASRGKNTLRFGPLKPAGLTDPKTGRWPYACLQLRRENKLGTMYNLVGFQTNLKWSEQKRVFSVIPALKNAEYLRYGVMHKNTFINSTKVLNKDYSLICHPKIFFAGQITGVEGYVESAMSGLLSAICLLRRIENKPFVKIPEESVCGSLTEYITTANKDFQPMNANFGIMPPLDVVIKDKAQRKKLMAERSLKRINEFKEIIENE